MNSLTIDEAQIIQTPLFRELTDEEVSCVGGGALPALAILGAVAAVVAIVAGVVTIVDTVSGWVQTDANGGIAGVEVGGVCYAPGAVTINNYSGGTVSITIYAGSGGS